jgi:protein dithiol oxidoreductase (disulfide-forming)
MRTTRLLVILAAVLTVCALGYSCARKESTAPAPPPPAADSQALQAPPAPAPAPSATSAQSETEQATASQESAGSEADHQAKSDASLEKIASLPPAAQLPAGKWQPGVNYDPVVPAQPTSVGPGKVEVLEVFWLACPHCYALEPYLRSWLKTKPSYVEFVRVPVYWQPIHRAHARLYYTLDALGRQDLVEKAFDTIHQDLENHVPPLFGDSEDDTFRMQQQFAVKNGVSADDFAKAYNSFTVNSDLARADEITQRYRVEGVPLIAVNGKYTTDVGKAGGEQKLIDLINDLAAAEHGH